MTRLPQYDNKKVRFKVGGLTGVIDAAWKVDPGDGTTGQKIVLSISAGRATFIKLSTEIQVME